MFFVVVVSALVPGTTLDVVARRLGLRRDPRPADVTVDVTPLGASSADVVEVELDTACPLVGRTIADAPPPSPLRIVLVARDGVTFAPEGSTRLHAGDVLVLGVSAGRLDVAAVERWLAPPDRLPEPG